MANCSQEITEYTDCTLTTCNPKATPIGPSIIPGISNLSIGLICLGVIIFLLVSTVTTLSAYIYVLRRRNWERLRHRSPSISEDSEDPIISKFKTEQEYYYFYCYILYIGFLDLITDPFPFPGRSRRGLRDEVREPDADNVPPAEFQEVPMVDDPIGEFAAAAAASPPQLGTNKVQGKKLISVDNLFIY